MALNNIKARRIGLNLELPKKSVNCLEYILVHEMVHLLPERKPLPAPMAQL
ncbi:MAG: YgjP-like metallopeptidase domain-containing protein [Desulfobulbaceae bacterium]|nr:YgjP-like metallopeptidase domain-containing protein [Desulfobulbaceae bacterium]